MTKEIRQGDEAQPSAILSTNEAPKRSQDVDALKQAIAVACESSTAFTPARRKALATVRWVLRDQFGQYAALGEGFAGPASIKMVADVFDAVVFDGRDNEEAKIAFYNAMTGLEFEAVLL